VTTLAIVAAVCLVTGALLGAAVSLAWTARRLPAILADLTTEQIAALAAKAARIRHSR